MHEVLLREDELALSKCCTKLNESAHSWADDTTLNGALSCQALESIL